MGIAHSKAGPRPFKVRGFSLLAQFKERIDLALPFGHGSLRAFDETASLAFPDYPIALVNVMDMQEPQPERRPHY
jgi:hypothetical protein